LVLVFSNWLAVFRGAARLRVVKQPKTYSKPYPIPEEAAALPDADEQAVAWVIRLTSGDTSAAERAAFELWRNESPTHEAAFSEARKLWSGLGDILPAPVIVAGVASESKPPAPTRRRLRPNSIVALAASIALLVGIGAKYMTNWRYDHVTAPGQREVVALADGSRVQLSSDSAIDIRYSADVRQVRLVRGEAYFDVVHDARRPFVVDAGDDAVHDIGTAFSVRLEGDGVVVVVERGAVEVTGGAAPVLLAPNQRVRYGKGRNAGVEPANIVEDLAWTSGRLVLEDRSLREVVDELNRYFASSVVLLGGEIGAQRINAVVDLDHIDAWLDALQDSQGVKVAHLPGFVVLY
jgi:transmembrane sensor